MYAFRFVKNREEAEDAVQEVFVRLWNMGKKLDSINSVEALAFTMTKNYCIDLLRKQKHSSLTDDLSLDKWSESTPHEIIEQAESGIIIRQIIDELPELYRTIINLHEIDGLSYEEISVKTGQNINSLRVIISRARSTIRDKYKSYFNEKRRT
jgi:RNA polymerase sigma-70 factor (ECF subfamily)